MGTPIRTVHTCRSELDRFWCHCVTSYEVNPTWNLGIMQCLSVCCFSVQRVPLQCAASPRVHPGEILKQNISARALKTTLCTRTFQNPVGLNSMRKRSCPPQTMSMKTTPCLIWFGEFLSTACIIVMTLLHERSGVEVTCLLFCVFFLFFCRGKDEAESVEITHHVPQDKTEAVRCLEAVRLGNYWCPYVMFSRGNKLSIV